MRILLTGAAGFIGRHVHELLHARGHDVTGVDAFLRQVHGDVPKMPTRYVWRTTVGNAALQWAKDPNQMYECVVHLAAHVGVGQSMTDPVEYVEHNVMETVRLWRAILKRRRQVGKVVCASSMSIYGEGEYSFPGTHHGRELPLGMKYRRCVEHGWNALFTDPSVAVGDGPILPFSPDLEPRRTSERKVAEPASTYAQSKWDTERYSMILGGAYQIPTVALRFFNTYGAGQALANPYTGALAMFACRLLNDRPPIVFEDGLQTRDFIHVSDVAAAVVAAVEADGLQGVYNVGTGTPTTLLGLVDALRAELDGPEPIVTQEYRVGDVRHCYSDPSALNRATGWKAELSLADGIGRTAPWIRDQPRPVDRTEDAIAELRAAGLLRKPEGR